MKEHGFWNKFGVQSFHLPLRLGKHWYILLSLSSSSTLMETKWNNVRKISMFLRQFKVPAWYFKMLHKITLGQWIVSSDYSHLIYLLCYGLGLSRSSYAFKSSVFPTFSALGGWILTLRKWTCLDILSVFSTIQSSLSSLDILHCLYLPPTAFPSYSHQISVLFL
jgi:hypothetical protein